MTSCRPILVTRQTQFPRYRGWSMEASTMKTQALANGNPRRTFLPLLAMSLGSWALIASVVHLIF